MNKPVFLKHKLTGLAIITFLVLLVCTLGCSSFMPIAGASGGAALGSLAGPGGAALGAAAGTAAGQIAYPADVPAPPPPDTVWGLLAKLLDQAVWLGFLIGALYLLTLFAPPPKEWFKKK